MSKFIQRLARTNTMPLYHQTRMISTIKVQALCERQQNKGIKIIKARMDDSVRTASQLMENNRIGALMVEDEDHKVVGILTARDVQSAVAQCDDVAQLKAEFSDLSLVDFLENTRMFLFGHCHFVF